MVILLCDASAVAKRYAPELGSDVVDALFTAISPAQCVSSVVTYTEVYSILLRKRNRGAINQAIFEQAKSNLLADLVRDPEFVLLSIDDDAFYSGVGIMEAHNLNSTDAALLSLFKAYIQTSPLRETATFLLVAADARLVRAAELEGIQSLNPEVLSLGDFSAFMESL